MLVLPRALMAALPFAGVASAIASPSPSPSLLVSEMAPTEFSRVIRNSYRGHCGDKYVYVLEIESLELIESGDAVVDSLKPLEQSLDHGQLLCLRLASEEILDPADYDEEERAMHSVEKQFELDSAVHDFRTLVSAYWHHVQNLPLEALRRGGAEQAVFGPQRACGADWGRVVEDMQPITAPLSYPPSYFAPQDVTQYEGVVISLVHDADLTLLDRFLPKYLEAVVISPSPKLYNLEDFADDKFADNKWGVPKKAAEHLANITKHLRFNSELAEMVGTLSAADILADVQYLTGERSDSDIESRNSFHPDARKAVQWIAKEMAQTGATCDYFFHGGLIGFSPPLICTFPRHSDSESHVVLSAHYDSRGYFGSTRAPGADDDGSGTAHLMNIGRAIGRHNLTFEHPLSLAFFSGEEQGLWGSHYFAKHLKHNKATVQLNVNADMLGYRVPGEPMQLALPATIELAEAGYLVGNMSKLYAPELVVGRTAVCCSDHQSFLEYGFPATHVFERNGPIADPMYHASDDLSDREGFDAEQIRSIAKVTMASVLEVAGWSRTKHREAEAWKFPQTLWHGACP